MKKVKKVYFIFVILIAIFTIGIINKQMRVDTFYYIPIGEYIAKTHAIDGLDHWSFHQGLRFTYPRLD